jgi:hypothetical protein
MGKNLCTRRQKKHMLIYSSLSLSHSMLHRSFPLNNFCFCLHSKLLNTSPLIYPRHAIFKTGFVCGALMKKWRGHFGNVAINTNKIDSNQLLLKIIVFSMSTPYPLFYFPLIIMLFSFGLQTKYISN